MNKKYLIYSFLFIASISFHSFADHHDHFNSNEENIAECQACEENVEIQIFKTKTEKVSLENSPKTNLISRFFSFKTKLNLSRAPPS